MYTLFTQLWRFMRVHRKFWMGPIVFILVALGGLLILAQSSAVSPFLYAIF